MSWFFSKSGYDADAQAYFDRVVAVGGGTTIDTATRIAVNNFVSGTKTDGTWPLLLDVLPLCSSGTSGALVKLKTAFGSDYDASITTGHLVPVVYSQAAGFTLNGENQYINTKVVANTLTVNNTGVAIYSRLTINSTTMLHGALNGGNRIFAYLPDGTNNKVFAGQYSSTYVESPSALSGAIGLVHFTNDGGTHALYRNGTQLATLVDTGTLPAYPIYYGCWNNAGTPVFGASLRGPQTFGFLAITAGMDSTEAASLYTRVQALQTALGRNV